MKTATPTPVAPDTFKTLEALIQKVKTAQAIYATYSQEQVDKIFRAAALAANNARIRLAKMAVEEVGQVVAQLDFADRRHLFALDCQHHGLLTPPWTAAVPAARPGHRARRTARCRDCGSRRRHRGWGRRIPCAPGHPIPG